MFDFLNFLSIETVEQAPWISPEEQAQIAQAAKDKVMWIVILSLLLIVEISLAFALPKIMAKRKEKEAEKARRKRIQSKRK